MRWIKQRNEFSCVPVAFLNILKWKGDRTTYRENYKTWAKECHTEKTGSWNWTSNLRKLDLEIKQRVQPSIREIIRELDSGSIVLMKSAWTGRFGNHGHAFLVTKNSGKSLFCVNVNGGHKWVSYRKFIRFYMEKFDDWRKVGYSPAPQAIFLRKHTTLIKKEINGKLPNPSL